MAKLRNDAKACGPDQTTGTPRGRPIGRPRAFAPFHQLVLPGFAPAASVPASAHAPDADQARDRAAAGDERGAQARGWSVGSSPGGCRRLAPAGPAVPPTGGRPATPGRGGQLALAFAEIATASTSSPDLEACAFCDVGAVIVVMRVPLCARHVSPGAKLTRRQRRLARVEVAAVMLAMGPLGGSAARPAEKARHGLARELPATSTLRASGAASRGLVLSVFPVGVARYVRAVQAVHSEYAAFVARPRAARARRRRHFAAQSSTEPGVQKGAKARSRRAPVEMRGKRTRSSGVPQGSEHRGGRP